MNVIVDSLAYWLADVYLAATVLFVAALVAMRACRQPAKRLAVAKAAIVAAALLAALCALPGWSVVSLGGVDAREAMEAASAVIPVEGARVSDVPRFDDVEPVVQSAAPLPRPLRAEGAWNWDVPWLTLLVVGYFVGCAAMATWLALGVVAATRLVQRAEKSPGKLREALRGEIDAGELLVSREIDVPVALGVFRPRVLLPREWIETRTEAELSTVLAHEAAHIRNHDLRWLAASRLLLIVLWAQPPYWWLRRQMRLDQETLADAAAAEVAGRQAYAEQLVAWARDVVGWPRPLLPASVGLWEGASQLRRRVAVLLDERFTVVRRCSGVWACSVLMVAVSFAALLSIFSLAPIANVAVAAPERKNAPSETETQHSVDGRATVTVFRAGDPAMPWDYEPNAVRLEVEDVEGKPMAGVEATLYRVAQATGVREQAGQATSDEHGVIEFRDVVDADLAADFRQRRQQRRFAGSLRDMYYLVLKQPTLGTVILPASDFAVASRGLKRRVRMRPAAELTGRVTDKDGKPVEVASVTAGALSGYFSLEGANAVTTDSEGRYRFTDLVAFDREAGKSRIEEQMKWATAANPPQDKLYPPVYDPAEAANNRLVVTHPDFAVTSVEGGNIPGETNVVMQPAAAIEGRVIEYGTGKPAVGVTVRAVGRLPSRDGQDEVFAVGRLPHIGSEHAAKTRTDADGRYRLASLPAGRYDIWAEAESNDQQNIAWVSTTVGNLDPTPGSAPLRGPDLVIGPGGTIHGRLIDASTRKPLDTAGKNLTVRAGYFFLDGSPPQQGQLQEVPIDNDGKFTVRAYPARTRLFVNVRRKGEAGGPPQSEYRSPDDLDRSGQAFDLKHGEAIDADVPVVSAQELEQVRGMIQRGFEALQANEKEKAIQEFSEAIAIDDRNTAALQGRGQAFERQGKFAEAAEDYATVLRVMPDDIGVMWKLVGILSSSPDDNVRDGKRAVELAARALAEMKRRNARPDAVAWGLGELAAAQAEAGDFEAAAATQREAIEKAPEGMRAEMRKRLEAYEAGRAWRREGREDEAAQ